MGTWGHESDASEAIPLENELLSRDLVGETELLGIGCCPHLVEIATYEPEKVIKTNGRASCYMMLAAL